MVENTVDPLADRDQNRVLVLDKKIGQEWGLFDRLLSHSGSTQNNAPFLRCSMVIAPCLLHPILRNRVSWRRRIVMLIFVTLSVKQDEDSIAYCHLWTAMCLQ